MTKHDIHYSLQIVPKAKGKDTYSLVDEAIGVIQKSGLKYLITPMDTIIEGPYEQVQATAEKAQQACLAAGAEEVLVFIKMHYRSTGPVTMEEKRLDRDLP